MHTSDIETTTINSYHTSYLTLNVWNISLLLLVLILILSSKSNKSSQLNHILSTVVAKSSVLGCKQGPHGLKDTTAGDAM